MEFKKYSKLVNITKKKQIHRHGEQTSGWHGEGCVLSRFRCVQLFATLCTISCQPPPSVGFSRQEYLSALPCPLPGDLPDAGMETESLVFPVLADGFFISSATWEAHGDG